MAGVKGKSGRRRTPTSQIAIYNTRILAKRQNEPEALSAADMPVPDDFNATERSIWEYHHAMLSDIRVLAATDLVTLDCFSRTYAEYLELEAFIKENGRSYENESGRKFAFPEVQLRNEARRELRSLSASLGLSPSSRAGIETIGGDEALSIPQIT